MCRFIDIVALVTQIHIITSETHTRTTRTFILSGQIIEWTLFVRRSERVFLFCRISFITLAIQPKRAVSFVCDGSQKERSNQSILFICSIWLTKSEAIT